MNGATEENGNGVNEYTEKKREVLMWGYFPGIAANRSPLTSPENVQLPSTGESWKDVCVGGCGFGMAISASGKLMTWGSADDQGQSYLTSGKHGESPEIYPLPTSDSIVKAAAGWAHCISVTDKGEAFTWGWKECVPSVKINLTSFKSLEDETSKKQVTTTTEPGSPGTPSPKSAARANTCPLDKRPGDESTKRRRIASPPENETAICLDETLSMPPCVINLDPGVKITSVAAGGRHTLALSDVGQVWGWGYGGEGQLGLGSRIKMVASPHLIPCINPSSKGKESSLTVNRKNDVVRAEPLNSIGSFVKGIACGGRHSVVVTDTGVMLAFGWGLYGQCGQGNNDDMLSPTSVPSLLGYQIEAVAAGLWHTICISTNGRVHAFGGNQFGQLGLGTSSDQCETVPKLLDASVLESENVKMVSAGARHSAILTEGSKIFCWGWNKYGQLGQGDAIDRNMPSQVTVEGYVPKNIACGWWHTLALCEVVL